MTYRDHLRLDYTEQLQLGVHGHGPEANDERARRAIEGVAEHTADANNAYRRAEPMVEPYVPAPVGMYVLARNGGDVRDALSGRHDDELRASLDQAMGYPDDHRLAGEELQRIRDEVLRVDPQPEPATGSPSQRHLADVRESLNDAAEVSAATGTVEGGDGDARAAREASLRAASTVAPGQRGPATLSTGPSGGQRRQTQVTGAMVAAHERRRTDRIEDTTEQLRARDDQRDYPTMAQRDPQQEQRLQ